jgi:hypothetical protein
MVSAFEQRCIRAYCKADVDEEDNNERQCMAGVPLLTSNLASEAESKRRQLASPMLPSLIIEKTLLRDPAAALDATLRLTDGNEGTVLGNTFATLR